MNGPVLALGFKLNEAQAILRALTLYQAKNPDDLEVIAQAERFLEIVKEIQREMIQESLELERRVQK